MKKNDITVEKSFTPFYMSLLIYFKNKESVCFLKKIAISFLIVLLVLPVYCQHKKTDNEVIQAYELRMKGKYDEAKAMLEKILQQDSTNALANFEMYRLMDAYNTMNVDTSLYFCNKALRLDPQNSLYAFSKANLVLLKAFIAMQQGNNQQIKPLAEEACEAFQNVLDIKPGCKESMLYLIDIYGSLPEEMGGDKEKAEQYAQELEKIDKFYGARGRFILLQENTNEVEYWNNYITGNGESNDVLELLGRAYLMSDDTENAEKCFNKIIATDPSKQVLYLHIARAHIYRVMQGKPGEEELPLAKENFHKYLSGGNEKPECVESWCYGMLSRIESFLGNNEESKEYLEKASAMNPNFSRATAIPMVDTPPDKLIYAYSSYFRPF
jgi:tetratricopeptide (TPR) repeat protein